MVRASWQRRCLGTWVFVGGGGGGGGRRKRGRWWFFFSLEWFVSLLFLFCGWMSPGRETKVNARVRHLRQSSRSSNGIDWRREAEAEAKRKPRGKTKERKRVLFFFFFTFRFPPAIFLFFFPQRFAAAAGVLTAPLISRKQGKQKNALYSARFTPPPQKKQFLTSHRSGAKFQ